MELCDIPSIRMSRIVLFGATGLTGSLTAEALVRRGHAPLLVARSDAGLRAAARGLDVAVADAARPESLAEVVEKGDVLRVHGGPVREVGRRRR